MSESKRGCGYRKIGGLYLVSNAGYQLICDGLPMELEPCDCCGFVPQFTRGLQRISWKYILQAERNHHIALKARGKAGEICSCPPICPICHSENQELKSYGLMHVGKKFYTAKEFVREAENMGVSKRISDIPRWLILDETWILLAHDEVPKMPLKKLKENGLLEKEPETFRAVFYAFKPQRVEMPVWENEISNEEIQMLEKRGITPVLLENTPENRKRHKRAQNRKILERLLTPEPEEAED